MDRAEVLPMHPEDGAHDDMPGVPALELARERVKSREEWILRLQYRRLHKPREALMQEAAEIDLLTHEDEIRLGRLIQKGDLDARNQMVSANIRLAAKMAQKFEGGELSFEDLVHAGFDGLVEAANMYDPEPGTKFSTLAGLVIYQHIGREIAKMGRSVSLPPDMYRLIGAVHLVQDRLIQQKKRPISAHETAANIGDGYNSRKTKDIEKDVRDIGLVMRAGRGAISLNEQLKKDDPNSPTKQDMLVDEEQDVAELAFANIQSALLGRALDQLNYQEKLIINKIFGLAGEEQLSLQQIGKELGIGRGRVAEIRDESLEKLKTIAENLGLGI